MRRLRILDYPWHQVHSYRLHALPADFWFLDLDPVVWNILQRPIPPNWRGVISPGGVSATDFDCMILHLDQWCARHELDLRAMAYRVALQVHHRTGIIPVIIMHGTPDSPENRQAVLRLIGDLPVVCNSGQAAREWDGGDRRADCYGGAQFRHIIHGYNVDEFWSAPADRRDKVVVSVCSGGELSREYHGLPLAERLARDVPLHIYGPKGNRAWLNSYADYRQMLARSLIYFSPSRRGPMPGARTEAMLSGCCVVTVPGNDAAQYVDHGRTGYIADYYREIVLILRDLLDNPQQAHSVGQAGREAARQLFSADRYVADWLRVLSGLGVAQ